ncbi:hypothetical protein [Rhodococcus sp. 27YEA15]|uniref:hypothetical protein n=1 Tax=Rhodococcus sp. 27YEA15 TaxID=3156259 RepID=UPI003C7CE798
MRRLFYSRKHRSGFEADSARDCRCPSRESVVAGAIPDVFVLAWIEHEDGCAGAHTAR